MRERPIIMSAPMVCALLDGKKTQTRRLLHPQPLQGHYLQKMWGTSPPPNPVAFGDPYLWREVGPDYPDDAHDDRRCPYGKPGDRLWVRESWRTSETLNKMDATQIAEKALDANYERPWAPIVYDDGEEKNWERNGLPVEQGGWGKPGRRRLSRFMPRWASRITLEITDIRLERVHDISEEDAIAEGLRGLTKDGGQTVKYGIPDRDGWPGNDNVGWHWEDWSRDPREAYARLWNTINGERAPWITNPWVWVLSFKRIAATQAVAA